MRMLMNKPRPRCSRGPGSAGCLRWDGTGREKAGKLSTRSCDPCASSKTTRRFFVQSGKPVGKFRTHDEAPRVLIANSNLVGQWNNYAEFNRLERMGLTMYGQMTAGSWIYIGSPGDCAGHIRDICRGGP